jgi:hypothetical protein
MSWQCSEMTALVGKSQNVINHELHLKRFIWQIFDLSAVWTPLNISIFLCGNAVLARKRKVWPMS